MKEIQLTKGYVAIVDDDDYEECLKLSWHVAKNKDSDRVVSSIVWKDANGKRKMKNLFLHNFIGEYLYGPFEKGFYMDHINRNCLDNRRENLRLCNHWQNCHNRDNGSRLKKKSGLPVGIYTNKNKTSFFAHLRVKGKAYVSKTFPTIEEAQEWRKELQEKLVGEFAFKG